MDIPAISYDDSDGRGWHEISRAQLLSNEAEVWKDLKNASKATIQTRFACNEYQFPALWSSTDRQGENADRQFSAVLKNVEAALSAKDLGWSRVLKPLMFGEPVAAGPRIKSEKLFFGLPGLLWAMGVDGGLRREGRLRFLQQALRDLTSRPQTVLSIMSDLTDKKFPIRSQVLPTVQATVISGSKPSRFSQPIADSSALNNAAMAMLPLDKGSVKTEWQADEGVWTWCLQDIASLPIDRWKSGAFLEQLGDKSISVVFGIEGKNGQPQEWAWGISEDWGLDVNGRIAFDVWPLVDDGHGFRHKNTTPHVVQSTILDMAQLGDFYEGFYVLYLQISLL